MAKEDLEVLSQRIAQAQEKERKIKMKKRRENFKKKKEGFWSDFKKFITRGNVLDMAVGVMVGSAFTAIINALSGNILKPFINYILAKVMGQDSLSEVYTFLQRVNLEDGTPDLTQSIYIDWGAFINAILNFFFIAFTLFVIVRILTGIQKRIDARVNEEENEKKALEAKKKEEEEKAAAEKAAAEKAALEKRETEFYANVKAQAELLAQIKEILEKK